MNKMFDYIQPFIPLFCVVVYLAIQSRWDACSRKKAYEELKLLNELRERSIITQEEFQEKKGELLSV